MGCDSNICIVCKEFYGWKGGKTLRKCSICYTKDRKRESVNMNHNRIGEMTSNGDKEHVDFDTLFADDVIIIKFNYDKKRRCKIKEMYKRKKRINLSNSRRKLDKISNIKQSRRFNQRYALSLQY